MDDPHMHIDDCTGVIDDVGWLCVFVPDGPRLNFNPTSMIHLRNFFNDPKQERAVISEVYQVERLLDGKIMLHVTSFDYQLSASAARKLANILNKAAGK